MREPRIFAVREKSLFGFYKDNVPDFSPENFARNPDKKPPNELLLKKDGLIRPDDKVIFYFDDVTEITREVVTSKMLYLVEEYDDFSLILRRAES